MKVALVQDWLVVNGGAEKVFKEMAACYPEAEIFSLIDFLSDEDRQELIGGRPIKTSFLQRLPGVEKYYRNLLPLFPMAIQSLDFSGFDLIISSSYSVAKGLRKGPGQIHICYCHSPVRYAWDLKDEYLQGMHGIKKIIANWILAYIRHWDLKTASNPDIYLANSAYVAERIERIYKQKALVLYPPVETEQFLPEGNKDTYYFTSARLVPYKKTDLIVSAFNEMPHLKLIVSGDGPQLEELKAIAGNNITFTGYLDRKDLIHYMQHAKAFVLAANEDFGISCLEAQSCLTPVIAYKKGGYLETVWENKTGVFFEEQTIDSIKSTVLRFEENKMNWIDSDFRRQVEKFSVRKFKEGFGKIVKLYGETNPK